MLMPTLLEIARSQKENGGIVLFDASVCAMNDFLELIFYAGNYAKLNKKSLEYRLNDTCDLLEFVLKKNTFTVKAAVEDFEYLQQVMNEKQIYFNEREKAMGTNKSLRKYVYRGAEKKSLFWQISNNIFEIYRSVRSNKLFKPDDIKSYDGLYTAIPNLLDVEINQQELNPRHHELYAAALYSSMQKPVTLIVAGNDFHNGLMLLMERLSPRNPPLLYFIDDNNHHKVTYVT